MDVRAHEEEEFLLGPKISLQWCREDRVKLARWFELVVVLTLAFTGGASAQGRGPGPGGPGSSTLFLVRIPEVQRELKLDEAQVEALDQLSAECRAKGERLGQMSASLSREERFKQFRELGEEAERKVAERLTDKQKGRLYQLRLQRAGMRSLEWPIVQDDLRLNGDQRQRVQMTLQSEKDSFQKVFEEFKSEGPNMSAGMRDRVRERFHELHSQTDTRLSAILSEGQRQKFQSIQGAPFKFPEFRRRGD